jgi:hypothetical protein
MFATRPTDEDSTDSGSADRFARRGRPNAPGPGRLPGAGAERALGLSLLPVGEADRVAKPLPLREVWAWYLSRCGYGRRR